MTISLPIKAFLGGLAIIVSLASAAQAGRALIFTEKSCQNLAFWLGYEWGGSSDTYETKGCYHYDNGPYGSKAYWGGNSILDLMTNANTGDGDARNGKKRFDQICTTGGPRPETTNGWGISKHTNDGVFIACDCFNDEAVKLFGWGQC